MSISMTPFSPDRGPGRFDSDFSTRRAGEVLAFHSGLPGYEATPLRALPALAGALGVAGLYVKDESFRFGLNAFKGLGGSYALARIIAGRTGVPLDQVSSVPAGRFTFVTATDGNHGRGVAWAARNLGQRAVVYLPAGTARERLWTTSWPWGRRRKSPPSTTTTPCATPEGRRRSGAGCWCRTPPGRAMSRSPCGSCRGT